MRSECILCFKIVLPNYNAPEPYEWNSQDLQLIRSSGLWNLEDTRFEKIGSGALGNGQLMTKNNNFKVEYVLKTQRTGQIYTNALEPGVLFTFSNEDDDKKE